MASSPKTIRVIFPNPRNPGSDFPQQIGGFQCGDFAEKRDRFKEIDFNRVDSEFQLENGTEKEKLFVDQFESGFGDGFAEFIYGQADAAEAGYFLNIERASAFDKRIEKWIGKELNKWKFS